MRSIWQKQSGDCFAASALYLCARLLLSAGGAAGMSCFLFCLFTRFELATRGSKCVAFGRNSPGDCFAASALYFCARLRISAGGAAGMSCFLFYLFARIELATRGSKCVAFGRNSPGDCFAASALYCCDRLSFFLQRSSTFSPALQYSLQYLVMRGIKKPGSLATVRPHLIVFL